MAEQKKRLGDRLIDKGVVSYDQVQIAITEQKKSKKALGQVFIDLGFVRESVIRDTLAESFGHQSIDLSTTVPDAEALQFIDKKMAVRNNIVPVSFNKRTSVLQIAIADVYDVMALDRLRSAVPLDIDLKPLLATDSQIRAAIDLYY